MITCSWHGQRFPESEVCPECEPPPPPPPDPAFDAWWAGLVERRIPMSRINPKGFARLGWDARR